MAVPITRVAPSSILFALYAERLLLAASPCRGKGGRVRDPEDELVSLDLAPLLVAVAIWSLREQGLLQLEVGETAPCFGLAARASRQRRWHPSTRWFKNRWWVALLVRPWTQASTWVRLTRVRHALLPGLEGGFLESLHERESTRLDRLVYRWVRTVPRPCSWPANTRATPHQLVVHSVRRDAAAWSPLEAGRDERADDPRALVTTQAAVQEHSQVPMLEEQFTTLLVLWRRFEDEEPALYSALLRECRAGIAARAGAVDAVVS